MNFVIDRHVSSAQSAKKRDVWEEKSQPPLLLLLSIMAKGTSFTMISLVLPYMKEDGKLEN